MNTLRSCCGCTILLIVLLLLLLISLIWLVISARSSHAQSEIIPCANLPLTQSIQLTAAGPLSAPSPTIRGTFFSKPFTMTLRGDACVVLASTPDGHGRPWVDDAILIQVAHADGTTAQWWHDFRTADRTQIMSIPPQNLSALFARGENRIVITLQDLSPNVYGSSALWLVVFAAATPTTTVSPIAPIPTATVLPQTSPTSTPTVALNIAHVLPNPPPAAAVPVGTTSTPFDTTPIIPAVIIGSGLGALILALVVVRRPSRSNTARVAPIHPGTLYLLDEKTFEAVTIELADWQNGFAVLADPFRVEPMRRGQVSLMRVLPCAEGIRLYADDADGDDPMLLRYGDSTNIGTVKLTLEHLPSGTEI